MERVLLTFAFTFILVMGLASANEFDTLGTFERDSAVELTQNCLNSTYANITKIQSATTSQVLLIGQISMTKNGDDYNYTTNISNEKGRYLVYGYCDENDEIVSWRYDYYIGEALNEGTATFYQILLGLLGLFFLVSLVGVFKVEDLKGKFALFWITYILFVAINYLAWNLADTFLSEPNFIISFFYYIFVICLFAVVPLLLFSFVYMWYVISLDKDVHKLTNLGMEFDEAYSRAKGRRKW